MKVFRTTKHPYDKLEHLHNPTGNRNRWNEKDENVIYCGVCIENVLAEFSHYQMINHLKKLKKQYNGSFKKIPPIANGICNGADGVLLSFNITNVQIKDLSIDSLIQQFCNAAGVNVLTVRDYCDDSFYMSTERGLLIDKMNKTQENVFVVASARSNVCNNLILHTDKFKIGDFTDLTRIDFKVYPSKKSKPVLSLKDGFSLNEVCVQFSNGNTQIVKVL